MTHSRAVDTAARLSAVLAVAFGAALLFSPSQPLSAAQAPAPAASGASAPQAAEAALLAELGAILDAQAADWSRGDVAAFATAYAEDATFISPAGMAQGRSVLIERYRKRYPDRAAMGTLNLEILEVRSEDELAAPRVASVATVVARWTLSYPDKPAASGLTLLVFHRSSAGWRIVQDASM
jgi:ketosteroid isomerase-like protein